MSSLEPYNPSGGQIAAKVFIWLIVGILIALLLFVVVSALGMDFFQEETGIFLSLLLVLLVCMVTVIASTVTAGIYNMIFSSDYYDFGKMFGMTIIAHSLLFLLMVPLYLMFNNEMSSLLLIVALHMSFASFVGQFLVESLTSPNYTSSWFIGLLLWYMMSIIIYLAMYTSDAVTDTSYTLYLSLLLPAILAYTLMPLCHSIWSKLYYGLYSAGSNPLYIANPDDVSLSSTETDSVNISL